MVIPGLQLCKPSGFLPVGKPEPDERFTEGMSKGDEMSFDPAEGWHQQRGEVSYLFRKTCCIFNGWPYWVLNTRNVSLLGRTHYLRSFAKLYASAACDKIRTEYQTCQRKASQPFLFTETYTAIYKNRSLKAGVGKPSCSCAEGREPIYPAQCGKGARRLREPQGLARFPCGSAWGWSAAIEEERLCMWQ